MIESAVLLQSRVLKGTRRVFFFFDGGSWAHGSWAQKERGRGEGEGKDEEDHPKRVWSRVGVGIGDGVQMKFRMSRDLASTICSSLNSSLRAGGGKDHKSERSIERQGIQGEYGWRTIFNQSINQSITR